MASLLGVGGYPLPEVLGNAKLQVAHGALKGVNEEGSKRYRWEGEFRSSL